MILKKCHLILCMKDCQIFIKLRNEHQKEEVFDNVGDRSNELYYIYRGKYREEKYGFNKKDMNKFDYTKLRPTDDYQYEPEEEEEQTDKKPGKQEPPKKNKK